MRQRLLQFVGVATTVAVVSLAMPAVAGQSPRTTGKAPTAAVKRGPALKTPWGEPDLQGIWTRDADVPLQRPIKYGNREFLTDAERAELDRQISGILARDSTKAAARGELGETSTESSTRPPSRRTCTSASGRRSSSIRRTGEFLPLTPEAQKARTVLRQFGCGDLPAADLPTRERTRTRYNKQSAVSASNRAERLN